MARPLDRAERDRNFAPRTGVYQPLLFPELNEQMQALEGVVRDLESNSTRVQTITNKVTSLSSQIGTVRENLDTHLALDAVHENYLQGLLKELITYIDEAEREIARLVTERDDLARRAEPIESRRQENVQEIERLRRSIGTLQTDKANLLETQRTFATNLRNFIGRIRATQLSNPAELQRLEATVDNLGRLQSELDTQLAAALSRKRQAEESIEADTERLKRIRLRGTEIQGKINALETARRQAWRDLNVAPPSAPPAPPPRTAPNT